MKRLILLSTIAMGSLFYANSANAQISIQFGINVPVHRVYVPAPQPVVVDEGPVYDNDQVNYNDDDYYYLPEVEAYYNVPRHCYYYNNGSSWVSSTYLPGAYRSYDWRSGVRYEVRAPRPYMHHDMYVSRWGGYAGDRGNWGHRFDRRFNGGYAYHNRDNRGWGRDNQNRGNWGGRPQGDNQNRGNWGRPQGDNQNRANWGGRPQGGNQNRGNQQQNNGGQNRGNWGGQQQSNRNDRGNNGDQRFAQNRGGFGSRQ
jgi:hypothetical protein